MPPFDGDETQVITQPCVPLISGRYEIRDRIGAGAMGQVLEAFDHRLRRLVALKLVARGDDAEVLRRFRLEAQAAARLRHPGIVAVHDEGEGPDFAWIAMELVIGETLRDALDRERPSLAETIRVVTALLDALGHAHDRGIVHRDVKPANILLATALEEGLGEVRLADFGIAQAQGSLAAGADRTRLGDMLGTPSVMAPEQVRGEALDERVDIWAAGVILYEMLTERRPFGGTLPGLYQAVLWHEPTPPSQLRPGLPAALDAVVARALAKDRDDRFGSAPEMAAALRRAVAPPARWRGWLARTLSGPNPADTGAFGVARRAGCG